MEFMPGATSRQQLVAIGDDVGTTHVYELPRTLCRPVANEEKLMRAFLDKEWARIEYLEQVPIVPGFDKKVDAFATSSGAGDGDEEDEEGEDEQKEGDAPPGTAGGAAPPADAGGFGDEEEENPQETVAAKAAAAKAAAREQAKKEEEEFLKMEEAFIAELGLSLEEVPEGLRGSWKAPE